MANEQRIIEKLLEKIDGDITDVTIFSFPTPVAICYGLRAPTSDMLELSEKQYEVLKSVATVTTATTEFNVAISSVKAYLRQFKIDSILTNS